MSKKVAVYRREHFNAAHRLYNPQWDDATNEAVFGKCNNPNFHGHNYELEVKVTGVPHKKTGYVMDMKQLSELIKVHVLDVFDHRNLNKDVSYFENLNPTAENIAVVIYKILRKQLDKKLALQVRLYETPRNYVEYPAS
ncbi:MAG: 6-carboxytetrahydropterin synthase [Flavihumibacter sp.]|nr:6-carboxytetrahydropterin synthase [Flavihumibacter sp.]